jgi:hypothetical protein
MAENGCLLLNGSAGTETAATWDINQQNQKGTTLSPQPGCISKFSASIAEWRK